MLYLDFKYDRSIWSLPLFIATEPDRDYLPVSNGKSWVYASPASGRPDPACSTSGWNTADCPAVGSTRNDRLHAAHTLVDFIIHYFNAFHSTESTYCTFDCHDYIHCELANT
jgi:hypothetical protein